MAHFAKIDNLRTVVFVTVGRDEDDGKELELCARTGDTYRQTSYNTRGGVHYDPVTGQPSADQSKAFRKNYAGIGYTYDPVRDAFIPPKPYPSWILDSNFHWIPPVPVPDDVSTPENPDGVVYVWDESIGGWSAIDF